MKKRLFILSVLICLTMIVGACGKATVNESDESNPVVENDSKDAITISVAHVVPESHPSHITLGLEFKEYVERESNGRLKIDLFPNGQLGSERQLVEAVALGTIDMSIPASSVLASFDDNFLVFDLPFLFKSTEAARAAVDGEFGEKVAKGLEKIDIINVGYAENGFRYVTNSVRPVTKPEDLKGIKIRTMENPIHIATFKAFGANPTPMAFGELYTALQQKTVDAQENPVGLIYANKLYEVQKYMSLTGHVYVPAPYIMNKTKFDSLEADLQKIIEDGVKLSCESQRKMLDDEADKMYKEIADSGTEIYDLTEKEKEAFVKLVEPVYEKYREDYGTELVDEALTYN